MFDPDTQEVKESFLLQLVQMREMDISTLPNYRIMLRLRNKLLAVIPKDQADTVVSRMKIEVSEKEYEDSNFVDKVVDGFAELLINIYVQCSFDEIENAFIEMASDFSIEIK